MPFPYHRVPSDVQAPPTQFWQGVFVFAPGQNTGEVLDVAAYLDAYLMLGDPHGANDPHTQRFQQKGGAN